MMQERQRSEPPHPLVGRRALRRPGRSVAADSELGDRPLYRIRPAGAMTLPMPRRWVSKSRTVIARRAGTVSSSSASSVLSTRRFANSGSQPSMGSSRRSRHSSTSNIAAAAVIGFVSDAMRKIVSRCIGALAFTMKVPSGSTCTSSFRETSVTRPGISARSI
jgi:hypothetical protein